MSDFLVNYFSDKTVIMDMSVTPMASVYQRFGITRRPCQKTVALDRVISTALGKWIYRR